MIFRKPNPHRADAAPMPHLSCAFLSCAMVALISTGAPAVAQDTQPGFALELNAAADTEAGSCRLTYVASNLGEASLDRVAYELAVFDAQGIVNRLLVLEFGALVAGKTKILQFDLAETGCADLSRIVVNTVAACTLAPETGTEPGTETEGRESAVCMDGLAASSRTAIQFGI